MSDDSHSHALDSKQWLCKTKLFLSLRSMTESLFRVELVDACKF